MRRALALLQLLTERLPPPAGRRHGLLREDDGQLGLCIWKGETPYGAKLEEGDLDRDPKDLVEEIVKLLPVGQ